MIKPAPKSPQANAAGTEAPRPAEPAPRPTAIAMAARTASADARGHPPEPHVPASTSTNELAHSHRVKAGAGQARTGAQKSQPARHIQDTSCCHTVSDGPIASGERNANASSTAHTPHRAWPDEGSISIRAEERCTDPL
ncbi:hypothetical protein D3C85_1094540 [compost metagenome]